jgi:transketolase
MIDQENLDQLCIRTTPTLCSDAVQKATSSHPGIAMEASHGHG